VPLWILAISFTLWIAKRIDANENVIDAEISE